MENHKFLINSVLVTLLSGVILASIGNYILYKFSNNQQLNLKTCDEKILEEANNRRGNNGRNGYTISFTGLVVTGMGLLFLIILSTFLSTNGKNSDSENFKNIIAGNMPVFLSLLVVSYIVSLYVNYKDRLIQGRVSNDFFSYLSFFTVMFLVQIATLSKFIISLNESKESKVTATIYALSLINILIIAVMNIILAFFSTDG